MSLKAKVSENDTTSGYLDDKVTGGVTVADDGGNETLRVVGGHWAVLTASVDQGSIDESVPDLVSNIDTVSEGSTGHGITVSTGVITLPAPSPGMKWELVADFVLTHSALGTATFRWYDTPSVANTPVGLTGYGISASNTSHSGGSASALAWKSGAGTMGLRCVSTTGANTVTWEAEFSKILIREVRA